MCESNVPSNIFGLMQALIQTAQITHATFNVYPENKFICQKHLNLFETRQFSYFRFPNRFTSACGKTTYITRNL